VGFPGETEQEFAGLLDFIREAQLDRVGCFVYSPVQGADANRLQDWVPAELAEQRRRIFMQTQAEISAARLRRFVGRELQVLVDERQRRRRGGTQFCRCSRSGRRGADYRLASTAPRPVCKGADHTSGSARSCCGTISPQIARNPKVRLMAPEAGKELGRDAQQAVMHVEHTAAPRGQPFAALGLAVLGVVYGDIGTSPIYALR